VATFDDVRRLLGAYPETAESTSYGTPAMKVRKKLIARLWGEREHARDGVDGTDVLVVLGPGIEEKAALLEAHGPTLFSTPHYDGHGAYLVRLADIDEGLLADLLDDAWLARAPKRLAARVAG